MDRQIDKQIATHPKHLPIHQRIRSAIYDSPQPTSAIGTLLIETSATALCGTIRNQPTKQKRQGCLRNANEPQEEKVQQLLPQRPFESLHDSQVRSIALKRLQHFLPNNVRTIQSSHPSLRFLSCSAKYPTKINNHGSGSNSLPPPQKRSKQKVPASQIERHCPKTVVVRASVRYVPRDAQP